MSTEPFEGTNDVPTVEKHVNMVQIVVVFQTESDAEALAVKSAIREALKDRKGIAIQLNMHEQPSR